MPTRLPPRRPLWRRAALSAATRENLAATAAEFVLALAFVTVVVAVLANMELIGASLADTQGTGIAILP